MLLEYDNRNILSENKIGVTVLVVTFIWEKNIFSPIMSKYLSGVPLSSKLNRMLA
jgi:hypothetical protein